MRPGRMVSSPVAARVAVHDISPVHALHTIYSIYTIYTIPPIGAGTVRVALAINAVPAVRAVPSGMAIQAVSAINQAMAVMTIMAVQGQEAAVERQGPAMAGEVDAIGAGGARDDGARDQLHALELKDPARNI